MEPMAIRHVSGDAMGRAGRFPRDKRHRPSVSRWRRWTGGLVALAASIMCLTILGEISGDATPSTPQAPQNSMAFHAPVVEKSALLKIELEQIAHSGGTLGFGSVVLFLLPVILWMAAWFQSSTLKRTALWSVCWALAGTWLLSLPDGWTYFIRSLGLFFCDAPDDSISVGLEAPPFDFLVLLGGMVLS